MKGLADTTAIRRRLLLTLFLPGVLVLAGGTVADYYATVRPLDQAYDEVLLADDDDGNPARSTFAAYVPLSV